MTQTGNTQDIYGKQLTVAIANTNASNVINSAYLPKSSIILSTDYNGEDKGRAAMLMTDVYGRAAIVSNYIEEENGLHSEKSNSNVISLKIDNYTIQEQNKKLSVDLENFVDSMFFTTEDGKVVLNTQSLPKASAKNFGVAKLDGNTIGSDNGTIYVNASKLDYASNGFGGVVKGNGNEINVNNGILSVDTKKLPKATNTSYGVAKVDGKYIVSYNGIISIDKKALTDINVNGRKMHRGDNSAVVSSNGILSINSDNLRTATPSNPGVAKIDPESLTLDSNNTLHVKDLDKMTTYIYDYEEGMNVIESKITYINNVLSTGTYVSSEPEIIYFNCFESTTGKITKPQYLEEPINMPEQHLYVVLSIVTNCKFKINVNFINNITPEVHIDNINYNDEFTIEGAESLNYVWPSTGLEQKRIIILINAKNFYSSTMRESAITKLSINAFAEEDNTKSKNVLYSIIRYNSAFNEEETIEKPEEIDLSSEYVVDETRSEWFYVNIDPTNEALYDYWDENIDTFDDMADYVISYGSIYSTIGSEMVEDSMPAGSSGTKGPRRDDDDSQKTSYALYLRGVYTSIKTGKSFEFLKKMPVENFDTNIIQPGKSESMNNVGVYDFPYKAKFDTLYFRLRYKIDNNTKVMPYEGPYEDGNISLHHENIYLFHKKDYKKEIDNGVYLYIKPKQDIDEEENNANIPSNYLIENNGEKEWTKCNANIYRIGGTYSSGVTTEIKKDNKCIENVYMFFNDKDGYHFIKAKVDADSNDAVFEENGNIYLKIKINETQNKEFGDQKYTHLMFSDYDFEKYKMRGLVCLYFVIPTLYVNFDMKGNPRYNAAILEEMVPDFVTKWDAYINGMEYEICSYVHTIDNSQSLCYGTELSSKNYSRFKVYSELKYSINDGPIETIRENRGKEIILHTENETSFNKDYSYKMIDFYINDNCLTEDGDFYPKDKIYKVPNNILDMNSLIKDEESGEYLYRTTIAYNFSYNNFNNDTQKFEKKWYWEDIVIDDHYMNRKDGVTIESNDQMTPKGSVQIGTGHKREDYFTTYSYPMLVTDNLFIDINSDQLSIRKLEDFSMSINNVFMIDDAKVTDTNMFADTLFISYYGKTDVSRPLDEKIWLSSNKISIPKNCSNPKHLIYKSEFAKNANTGKWELSNYEPYEILDEMTSYTLITNSDRGYIFGYIYSTEYNNYSNCVKGTYFDTNIEIDANNVLRYDTPVFVEYYGNYSNIVLFQSGLNNGNSNNSNGGNSNNVSDISFDDILNQNNSNTPLTDPKTDGNSENAGQGKQSDQPNRRENKEAAVKPESKPITPTDDTFNNIAADTFSYMYMRSLPNDCVCTISDYYTYIRPGTYVRNLEGKHFAFKSYCPDIRKQLYNRQSIPKLSDPIPVINDKGFDIYFDNRTNYREFSNQIAYVSAQRDEIINRDGLLVAQIGSIAKNTMKFVTETTDFKRLLTVKLYVHISNKNSSNEDIFDECIPLDIVRRDETLFAIERKDDAYEGEIRNIICRANEYLKAHLNFINNTFITLVINGNDVGNGFPILETKIIECELKTEDDGKYIWLKKKDTPLGAAHLDLVDIFTYMNDFNGKIVSNLSSMICSTMYSTLSNFVFTTDERENLICLSTDGTNLSDYNEFRYQIINSNGNFKSVMIDLDYIPNLINVHKHFKLDVYSDFVVPRFTKPFDRAFNPYEFGVYANVTFLDGSKSDRNMLNKKVENAKTVSFELKYHNRTISSKEFLVRIPKEDKTTYLAPTYNDGDLNAWSYFTYSSESSLAYWNIKNRFDDKIINFEEMHSKIEGFYEKELMYIDKSVNLLPINSILDREKTQIFLTSSVMKEVLWNFIKGYNINDHRISEFKLAKANDHNYSIVPKLYEKYNMQTYQGTFTTNPPTNTVKFNEKTNEFNIFGDEYEYMSAKDRLEKQNSIEGLYYDNDTNYLTIFGAEYDEDTNSLILN